jgi:hypothetical protein
VRALLNAGILQIEQSAVERQKSASKDNNKNKNKDEAKYK